MYSNDQLRSLFQGKFDLQDWNKFVLDVVKPTAYRQTPEQLDLNPDEGTGYYLGQKKTDDNYEIGLFYLRLNSSVKSRRVGLRQLVKPYVRYLVDAALVVFDDGNNWRLSFICDLQGNATAPKRYTFVFGDANNWYNTAVSRFVELQSKGVSFANLKEAFSVEALTKEFYNKLYNWFLWAKDKRSGVTFPNNIDTDSDDRDKMEVKMIRLITRMLFVWFIKQKHLVPGNLFDMGFLATILRDFRPEATDNGDYYNAILQNLFFATLNQEKEGRKLLTTYKNKSSYYSNKQLYRDTDKSYFTFPMEEREKHIKGLFEEIPYLNGGLFECLDKYELDENDKIKQVSNYDGFSHENIKSPNGNFKKKAFIPNALFFAAEHHETITIKEATNDKPEEIQDITVMGLIELFKQYNFTVEENTTSDVEVSLDPELLGRVFENLLAAYNPETQESARKSTGSYYTPREIVDYMVEESLIAFLSGECGHDEAQMRGLVKGDTHQAVAQPNKVIEDLKNIKVLDPACGSGAFPMGMLLKITDIIEQLTPEGKFNRYDTKLEIIKKCIYGVDIQAIAMLICKLRFFISLICDCEKDSTKDNFGIIPLPNLETKFVAANSLLPAKVKDFDDDWTQDSHLRQLQKELLELRQGIFDLRTHAAKRNNKIKDREKCLEIKAYIRQNATQPNAEKVALLEKQIADCEAQLPLYEGECWVEEMISTQTSLFEAAEPSLFRRDVNKEKRDKLQADIKKAKAALDKEQNKTVPTGFEAAVDEVTEWDPYNQNAVAPFFDAEWMFGIGVDASERQQDQENRPSKQGFDIVIGNPPYIRRTSINDVDKKQYEKTFVSATKQYDMYLLFIEKGVQMLTHNGYLCYINPIRFFNSDYGYGCRQYLVEYHKIKSILDISQLSVFQNAMTYPCVILVQNDKSDNENNIISYRRLPELEDLQNVEHIKPVLTSQKEIMYDSEKRLIVYVSPSMRQVIKKVDSISTTVFSQFNIARGLANNKVNFGGIQYKALKSVNVKRYYIAGESRTIDTEYADIFHDEMIIMPRTVAFLQSMLKERDIICLDRIYYLYPKQKVNLKYVLGVLNSRITNAWFEYYFLTTKVSGNYFDLNGNQIGSIPIPTANPNQQQPVIDLVNQILSAKKANPDADTSEWERQIDALVYDLYGLNEDEIRIIEG